MVEPGGGIGGSGMRSLLCTLYGSENGLSREEVLATVELLKPGDDFLDGVVAGGNFLRLSKGFEVKEKPKLEARR